MDKTIETKFLDAFKFGGVVYKCIDWMRYTYNLPTMKPNIYSQSEAIKTTNKKLEKYYSEILPKEILEATEAFDYSVIMNTNSTLMDEIELNLNECQTEFQKERYLFSLLKPFGANSNGCGIATIYNPQAEINQLNQEIKDLEKEKSYWITEQDTPHENTKEQIESCNKMIIDKKEQIDWLLYVNSEFCERIGGFHYGKKWMLSGTVENCLNTFVRAMAKFANRLDALLLTYGIDLIKLQYESGLYLKGNRLITDIVNYIGSIELTQKYINALPKESQSEQYCLENESNLTKSDNAPTLKRGKGRPKDTLKDKMIDDIEGEKLKKLHNIMNKKKGKDAALIILSAIKLGWMQKPTFTQVTQEFGNIGSQQGFTNYLNEEKFTRDEINGTINCLNKL